MILQPAVPERWRLPSQVWLRGKLSAGEMPVLQFTPCVRPHRYMTSESALGPRGLTGEECDRVPAVIQMRKFSVKTWCESHEAIETGIGMREARNRIRVGPSRRREEADSAFHRNIRLLTSAATVRVRTSRRAASPRSGRGHGSRGFGPRRTPACGRCACRRSVRGQDS